MKTTRFFLILSLLLITSANLKAQSDLKLQGMFLYNFIRMMAWPDTYQHGDFIVGVFGDSPIISEIESIASSRRAGNQNIKVVKFGSASEITRCHMLYVPSNQSRRLPEIVAQLKGDNISALVVSDSRNATRDGAMVNFINVNNSQRYEMCLKNTRTAGLVPGSDMVRLAIIIEN